MRFKTTPGCAAALIALCVFGVGPTAATASAQAELVTSGLEEPGSTEYHPASDAMILGPAPAAGAGSPMQIVSGGGTRAQFGRTSPWPAGAPILVVKGEAAGFAELDVFSSRRVGQIVKLADDGDVENDVWASLPGEKGLVTALHIDRTGEFGGALLAGTSAGNIWQVDASGEATLVAATGLPVAAILALPSAERYGAWAGLLLAATAPPSCRVLIVTPGGAVTEQDFGFCASDLDIVEPNADLFVAVRLEKAGGALLRTPASQLAASACNVIVADRAGGLVLFASGGAGGSQRMDVLGAEPRGIAFAASTNLCQPELCGDGIDNNANGETDERCREVCGDGIDNNSDGDVDEDCAEQCGDGIDDDNDGVVDNGCEEICGDGIDNDGDGVDASCTETCGDGFDNDRDGETDEDCAPTPVNAGCAPAVWARNPGAWTGLEPGQLAGTVFLLNNDLAALGLRPLSTFLDAPANQDGLAAAASLVRAAIAALLNAASPQVGYPLSTDRLLLQVNGALESGRRERITALTTVLDSLNELGCPLRVQPAANRTQTPRQATER